VKLRYKLSPEALQDIRDIWEFIAEDSIDAADRVYVELFEAIDGLAQMPQKGHRREDLVDDLAVLFWPVRSYLIIYRPELPLQIVRVVHGARDVPALF
jgi:plasmid stabilization system protein ParE